MKLFDFDLDRQRRIYRERGWIHAASGISAEFLEHLTETVDARIGVGSLDGPGLAGAKQQFLFELPPDVDIDTELLDPVSELFGLDRDRITLSERHLKVYDADADPDPLPHKDRLASTVSVGITIRAPEGTRAFLYPDRERDENPFMGPHLVASLGADRHPTTALDPGAAVELHDQPGDVLAFAGSSIWHGRRDAAGAVLLYLKFNAFGADPLAEDPRVDARRKRSRALAESMPEHARVALGPRFVSIAEHAVPPRWEQVRTVEVWDRGPLWITELEERLLRMATAPTTVGDLVGELGDREAVVGALRRMADVDVVVLSD